MKSGRQLLEKYMYLCERESHSHQGRVHCGGKKDASIAIEWSSGT